MLELEGQLTAYPPDQPPYHETPHKTLGTKDNLEAIPPTTQLNRRIIVERFRSLTLLGRADSAVGAAGHRWDLQPQALEASTKSNTYIK